MAETRFKLDVSGFDDLTKAMKAFEGDAEKTINDVLHNEASPIIQKAIRNLIPVSGREWKGKLPPAKTGKSLTDEKGNLFVTVKTTKNYQYLYFPDLGTTTRRHIGKNGKPQEFFKRGGESVQGEIVERCIGRLTKKLEEF